MNYNRRRFLRRVSAGGLAYALSRTPGTVWGQMAGAGGFGEYRALVCVFMFGGNDSWNMVVPRTTAEYNAYNSARGGDQGVGAGLAVPLASLLPIDPIATTGAPFGFHPSMTGVQQLFQTGKAAVVTNIGPLLAPTTKAAYAAGSANLPPQLFSHNDQQDQWHSLRGRTVSKTGWAGRVADLVTSQVPNQQLAVNLSLAGNSYFQAADTVSPYVMGSNGPVPFRGFGTTGTNLARRQTVEAINNQTYGTIYERAFAGVTRRAVTFADRVNAAINAAPPLVALPNSNTGLSSLEQQLRTVAKLISQRDTLSMTRQIFFVSTGGFDSHDDQNNDQPVLLANISSALSRFYAATEELGVQNSVVTFTQSDFGRTLTSNGDGSDHAWGGQQLVVGGPTALLGQRIYGTYPTLAINGPDDVGGGRLIPTTSSDQYAATLARWFGVTDAQMPQVAPSINNFTTKNLGFLA
jgi:uncharacterized protein (DUF1501 family)